MRHKKLLFFLIIIIASVTLDASAGSTTITGSASCVMPELLELKSQPLLAAALEKEKTPFKIIGAQDSFQVYEEDKKEEKPILIQSEEDNVRAEVTGRPRLVKVYSVCAR